MRARPGTEAEVDALAEADVPVGPLAVDVEDVRIGEHIRLVVGGGEVEEDPCSGGNLDAADRRVSRGDSPPGHLARLEPQRLLDGIGGERRVGDEGVPLVAARQQAAQRVAQQGGDRVVAGEADPVDDRLDLVVADPRAVVRIGVGLVGVEQLGAEVVGPLVAPRRDELPAVVPVIDHAAGDGDLLLGVGWPHENALRLTHHDLIITSSSGGKPISRKTISAGSGNASAPTYSAGEPAATIASIIVGGPCSHVAPRGSSADGG